MHPLAKQPTTDVTANVTTDVTEDVAALLQVVQANISRPTVQAAMGLRNAEHSRKTYLVPVMTAGHLEMTLLDNPSSTKQHYRLTPLGLQRQHLLKGKQ